MGKKNTEPEINQPNIEEQKEYASLIGNDATIVHIRDKAYLLRWLKNGQIEKLSRVLLRKKDKDNEDIDEQKDIIPAIVEDRKLACKVAAIYLLDGYWKIKFRYWYLWRWFYYIRQYDDLDLMEVLNEGKKKVPQYQFLAVIMSLTGAKDTLMTMRTEEAERILQELSSVQHSPEQKKDNGSSSRDISSSGS